ncbi:MAG TPA: hypothetical protein PL048_16225 [Leptospiraceae bacterium]|nr:hypothetical protein [Leptospiraceae bacterium]HMY66585.1 hypothetical protein [Leptospiraceae bacterium]HMZ60325.1 hypothetical protein [Leptospiraceae bacterium]HNF14222.1 hypothetical protein [Leptospiraceae bacterium]HNF23190.1 hypothetical protein [Leptospiraceae bacterium]
MKLSIESLIDIGIGIIKTNEENLKKTSNEIVSWTEKMKAIGASDDSEKTNLIRKLAGKVSRDFDGLERKFNEEVKEFFEKLDITSPSGFLLGTKIPVLSVVFRKNDENGPRVP